MHSAEPSSRSGRGVLATDTGSRPIRIVFEYPQLSEESRSEFECLKSGDYVKIGEPPITEYPLEQCDPQHVGYGANLTQIKSDCWHLCTSTDILLEEAQTWMRGVIDAVRIRLQKEVHLVWPVDKIFTSGFEGPWSIGDFDEDDVSPPVCQGIPIPYEEALPGSLLIPANGQGDIRVYITFRPNPTAADGVTTICHRDGFGRPIVAHTNFHPPFVAYLYSLSQNGNAMAEIALRRAEARVLHEMMHALALTVTSLQQFRTMARRLHSAVEVRTSSEQRSRAHSELIRYLVTPYSRSSVQQHYQINVSALDSERGVPGLEILRYSISDKVVSPINEEVHISPQVARTDVSCPQVDEYSSFSTFSHAILNDSGWYAVTGEPEELLWRAGLDDNRQEPNGIASSPVYGCDATSPQSKPVMCSYHPEFKGFCTVPEDIPFIESYPLSTYVAPYRNLGSCKTGSNSPYFKSGSLIEEQFGPSSSCMFVSQGTETHSVCLHSQCHANGAQLDVGNTTILCPFESSVCSCLFQRVASVSYRQRRTPDFFFLYTGNLML